MKTAYAFIALAIFAIAATTVLAFALVSAVSGHLALLVKALAGV